MEKLMDIFKLHFKKYPLMEPCDAVKLVFQGEFGGGHIIENPQDSLANLQKELAEVPYTGGELEVEAVSPELCRVYLGSLLRDDNSVRLLNRIFVASAQQVKGSQEIFIEKLETLAQSPELPFSLDELNTYAGKYLARDIHPVSHSQRYKASYQPAYRVVATKYLPFIPLYLRLEEAIIARDMVVVAIDGNSGSGKSFLAELLHQLYGASIIPMDDFFLPLRLRTEQRLGEVGGNIHYERFIAEVISPLKSGDNISYRPFDCTIMDYAKETIIPSAPLIVCEGCYSLHPKFADIYDVKVLTNCSRATQLERILDRSGDSHLMQFVERWIPMEDRYLEKIDPASCDFVFNTDIT